MQDRNIPWLPSDRLYDGESYLWVKQGTDSENLQVGVGSPAVESLGEFAYLTLSEPGTRVARGEPVGSMEAAKITGEIVSPVSGTIVHRNEAALENPRIVSSDPYSTGWLLSIAPESWSAEKTSLHDAGTLFEMLPDDLRGKRGDA